MWIQSEREKSGVTAGGGGSARLILSVVRGRESSGSCIVGGQRRMSLLSRKAPLVLIELNHITCNVNETFSVAFLV